MLFFPWIVLLLPGHAEPTPDALRSLVETERAFAATSVAKGMKEAFLAYMAEDGVVFRPLPANGRQSWEGRPSPAATLAWEPVYAEVSAAADLGYTTGPWELRPPADQKERPTVHGHFISVWRRPAGGNWKVAMDIGVTHPAPEPGVGNASLTAGPDHSGARREPSAGAERDLLAAEKRFARDARRLGYGSALSRWGTPDLRWNHEGELPRLGLEAARAALGSDTRAASWTPQAAVVSSSGDLAATYGLRERRAAPSAAPDTSVFLHVWRRLGREGWKVALAVDNPLPRP